MNTPHNLLSQKSQNSLLSAENTHSLIYPLREMIHFEAQDNSNLESLIKGRPVRSFFELETSLFEAMTSHIENYFTQRGYNLSFAKNNDEYSLVVLTRNDFEVLGLESFNFDDFVNYKAENTITYLSQYRDKITEQLTSSCFKMNANESAFTRDEELSILDEFFN